MSRPRTRQFHPCEECESEFSKLKKENEKLKEQIRSERESSSDLIPKINDLESELFSIKNELDFQSEKSEEILSQNFDLRAQNEAMKRDFDQLETDYNALKIELSNTKVYPCFICKKRFRRSDHRARHQRICKISTRKISALNSVDPHHLNSTARNQREIVGIDLYEVSE